MDQTIISRPRATALQYDGRVGELYKIFLLNIVFSILTLGIFQFWAITRYRRYLWSRMRFQGERFEYTGTGGELFVGYLLAMLAIIGIAAVAFGLAFALAKIAQPLSAIPIFVAYVFVFVLAAGGVFSAQRYRLSRTLWCGIRGGMTGSMIRYGAWAVLYAMLAGLTLGQMVPWMQVRLAERRINASRFGNAAFACAGRAGQIYLAYLVTMIVGLVAFVAVSGGVVAVLYATLGDFTQVFRQPGANLAAVGNILSLAIFAEVVIVGLLSMFIGCWYTALFERHIAGNTTLAGMRFSSCMTGRGLLGLVVGNLLIMVFTLSLGYPIVLHRNTRFLARTLLVDGLLAVGQLAQGQTTAPRFGEGMFHVLDGGGVM